VHKRPRAEGLPSAGANPRLLNTGSEMERALNPTMTAGLDIRVVGDEVLVHDGGRNKVHVLNVTAGEILRLCDGEHTREDIVETVCTRFGADKDRVRLDVDRIIEEFRGLGIVG